MSDLSSWFKERPKWLQEAARMLLEKGELREDDRTSDTILEISL